MGKDRGTDGKLRREPGRKDLEDYQMIAETVGGVPSFRKQDNIIQGLVILACLVLGAGVGLIIGGPIGAGIGALIGLVASLLVSGAVLMVVGWRRAAARLKSKR
jgi:hypothetical protein